MALANGVLVHGPTSWACAVRADDGEIHVARGRKRLLPGNRPLLRGPARLLEALLVLPRVRRSLPEARFAFQRPKVLASLAAAGVGRTRRSARRAFRRPCRSSPPEHSRSRRRCSRSARATSPRTTARSTSRSGPTSTASARRRSTSAAARISSGRCSWRPRPARRWPGGRRRTSAGLRASWRRSARWRRRRRSSAGWCGTPSTRWRRRSPARATSSRSAWRRPSRRRIRSRSPTPRSTPASSSSERR